MPKPSWTKKDFFVTDKPTASVEEVDESFTVYRTYATSEIWWTGWKNYSKLWSALRFGMGAGRNTDHIAYVKNNKTNEIVWRSWEDENPYRDR
tara:strand:- start:2887 stop:3165 length:279 start_codon:yes stop_codon:yes gene_type:complete